MTVREPIADDNGAFYASGQVARQICELAKPGQVLVSDLVRQLVDGKGFVFESIGTKMFKDFAEPVTLYNLRLE
jgi:class 3 adenylate cyclase